VEEKAMPSQKAPTLLALVPADRILVDVATGKSTIEGTFRSLKSATFPFTCRTFAVYIVVTDGYGQTNMQLRLIDLDEEGDPILDVEAVVDFTDPLEVVELTFTPDQVTFPEPGEYRLQLFGAGEPLAERRVLVGILEEP
jgi:hypothetical protein